MRLGDCSFARLAIATLSAIVYAPVAFAYIDPGAGALLWQAAAAAFVGSLFYVRRLWGWVKGRSQRRSPPD